MRKTLRRVRAYSGHLGLLAVLALVGALLVSGVPRLENEYTDRGLRADVAGLPWSTRDLVFTASSGLVAKTPPQTARGQLSGYEKRLPAPIPGLVEDRWFAAESALRGAFISGPAPFTGNCRPSLRVVDQSGAASAVRVVEGRAPASRGVAETMVSRDGARLGGLRVGSALTIGADDGVRTPLRVVGIYEPLDAAAARWEPLASQRLICPVPDDGFTFDVALLTDDPGVTLLGQDAGPLAYSWRYRLAPDRLDASVVAPLTTAVINARRAPVDPDLKLNSTLDAELSEFTARQRSARATVAVVESGLVATVLGLIVLAALLMTDRRREEYALLSARGGTARRAALRTLAETALVTVPAVLLGWLAATLLPGRTPATEARLLAVVLVIAAGVAPLLAARSRPRPGRTSPRPGPRRLAAEVFLVLLAGLGVVLLRRRGLQDEVDPFLVVVPVLLGAAAALVVVRLLPWPLRQAGRLAARGRGLVGFLGLARAGRSAPLSAGPVAVLIVAAATGVFTAAVSTTIDDARDQASSQLVPADATVTGFGFAPDTDKLLTAVPGVRAAVPMLIGSGVTVVPAKGMQTQAQLLVVDGSRSTHFPAALSAKAGTGPIPVVVSPAIAAKVGAGGRIIIQGRRYDFRVDEVAGSMPGLDIGAREFIAVPWAALPVPDFDPLVPTRYLITGDGFDPEAVRVAANAGQREYYLGLLKRTINAGATEVTDEQLPRLATVRTWQQERRSLDESGVNALLSFVFTAGAAGSVLLALLAVGLAVLSDAPGRGQALSRLRTLGVSRRQGRNLLLLELAPLLAVAFVAGTLVGWALPRLIGASLGLDAFTAGIPAVVGLNPWLLLQALGLLLAGLITAVAVETTAHRRMRLGESLRLGEDN